MTKVPTLELWGGVECSLNRVHDQYFDQLERTGHASRIEDLDLFAELGVRALRYPILWERVALEGLKKADWSWADGRLNHLRDLNIQPIVGLVHHGNGPRHTNVLQPEFATELASYARAVAERYPWVDTYAPINEPLTTARFCALYGHWYPHQCEPLSFARALLIQCRAVVLSIKAIREVNPQARLLQTEDVGRTHSTKLLSYQAEFENERRWITFDLLCGRVNHRHRMWQYFRWLGVEESELEWFLHNPCPPDIIGIDYYLTSERFLDENLEAYPAQIHGGNGRNRYVDIEAVRVAEEGIDGPAVTLCDAWKRYGLPLAVTEAHLNSTREEQLRYFHEVWNLAQKVRMSGVDVRAVTAWSLLGAYDWHCLLTRCEGYYESGVFDLRSPQPRPTALAPMLKQLSSGEPYQHPVLGTPGWWHRPKRLLYQPVPRHQAKAAESALVDTWLRQRRAAPPLLVIGSDNPLGAAFVRLCDHRGLECHAVPAHSLDLERRRDVAKFITESNPWAVVNAHALMDVARAEFDPDRCYHENVDGPQVLAKLCAERELPLVVVSSDQVFDGLKRRPYVESDCVSPLNVFGYSMALMEHRVLQAHPGALVARAGALFGPWDHENFAIKLLKLATVQARVKVAGDVTISPTYIPDLVHACLDLLIDGETGIWHLTNNGAVTWGDFARRLLAMGGFEHLVEEMLGERLLHVALPAYSALTSERGNLLQTLDAAVECFFHDSDASWINLELTELETPLSQTSSLVTAAL